MGKFGLTITDIIVIGHHCCC